MKQLKAGIMATVALVVLSACSSQAQDQQKYSQLYKESPQKLMIVVHGNEAVPTELVQAFNKKVPAIAAEHGFQIVDAQQRQHTEIPALTGVDAVLYVDIKRWSKDSSAVIVAQSVLELEFKLVSAKSEQDLWLYQDKYSRTYLYLGRDIGSELFSRTMFEMSNEYENSASAMTKKAFADFPDLLAANH